MRILVSILILLSSPVFSEENAAEIDYLSEGLRGEIDSSDFKLIDELAENRKTIRDLSIREQLFKERKKPWSPVPFRALLLKGTRLVDLKTGKVFYTSSPLYVWAQEENIGSQESFVLNQDRVAKYRTFTKSLRSIENDISLFPEVDPNKVYSDKVIYHSTDKVLKLENHISFHIETLNNEFFADIYNGVETTSTANRFQLKTFYNSILPVDFGLSISYQEGLWNEADNQIKWTASYFGPSIRWQFAKWGNLHFNTKIGVERSFHFQANGDNSQSNFSSLLYEWELETVYHSSLGPILVGWSLRNMTWEIENSDSLTNYRDDRGDVISNSFFLGYRIDVDI